jgi:hypothetical protein
MTPCSGDARPCKRAGLASVAGTGKSLTLMRYYFLADAQQPRYRAGHCLGYETHYVTEVRWRQKKEISFSRTPSPQRQTVPQGKGVQTLQIFLPF